MDPTELPLHPAVVGVVLADEEGRVLMVRTRHRSALVLPGGLVEAGESPADTAERRLAGLGLDVRVTRLLVVQHRGTIVGLPSTIHFVFDSRSAVAPRPELLDEEVAEVVWLPPEDAVRRHVEGGQARVAAALTARRDGTSAYLDTDRLLWSAGAAR